MALLRKASARGSTSHCFAAPAPPRANACAATPCWHAATPRGARSLLNLSNSGFWLIATPLHNLLCTDPLGRRESSWPLPQMACAMGSTSHCIAALASHRTKGTPMPPSGGGGITQLSEHSPRILAIQAICFMTGTGVPSGGSIPPQSFNSSQCFNRLEADDLPISM